MQMPRWREAAIARVGVNGNCSIRSDPMTSVSKTASLPQVLCQGTARFFAARILGLYLPACLALTNALFWYMPSRDTLMGWGDDPFFNLWVHEHHWAVFSKSGPLAFLFASFWDSNIFYPEPLTIALSDNYVASGLLSWPLRLITGNGAQSLSALCVLENLTAFVCMAGWLRSLGARRLAWWGGLAFAGCGWVQTQSAHFQNVCIFVFPLALWMWSRYREQANATRFITCAAAFGWIIGWNVYFQTFANIILVALVVGTVLKRRDQLVPLLALLIATVIVEAPIVRQYIRLQSIMGDYSVGMGDFRAFAARWSSFFFHYFHKNWIASQYEGFYPKTHDATIESAGFIGYAWLLLWIRTLFARRTVRIWAWAAVAAFYVALGPDYQVFNLFLHFPGMSSLRAIGRAQAVSSFFSMTAIVLYLDWQLARGRLRDWPAIVPLLLIVFELVPGRKRDFVTVKSMPWVQPSTAQQIIAQRSESLLVLPDTTPSFQLYFVGVPVRLYSGYSGRAPFHSSLVYQSAQRVSNSEQSRAFLDFVQPPLVGAISGSWQALLSRTPGFESRGCGAGPTGQICLYAAQPQTLERWRRMARLRLDHDASWSYRLHSGHLRGELHATLDGTLDIKQLARCHLKDCVKYPIIPELCGKERLEGWQFGSTAYKTGDAILGWTSTRPTSDLPEWLGPRQRFAVSCVGP